MKQNKAEILTKKLNLAKKLAEGGNCSYINSLSTLERKTCGKCLLQKECIQHDKDFDDDYDEASIKWHNNDFKGFGITIARIIEQQIIEHFLLGSGDEDVDNN